MVTVSFEISGGTLSNRVMASGTPTLYGWLAAWNTTRVANGIYTLRSVASFGNGESGTSPGVTITVARQTFLLEQHPRDVALASGHRLHVDTASMSRVGRSGAGPGSGPRWPSRGRRLKPHNPD